MIPSHRLSSFLLDLIPSNPRWSSMKFEVVDGSTSS
jgi:hypothetical protein